MQYSHLREHAISCFLYDDAARSIKNAVRNNDAPSYGQAVHEAAVLPSVFKPRFINTPVQMFFAQFLVTQLVAVVTC